MSRLTKMLVGIVVVSLPITGLVLWLAARTQAQIPLASRSEDSTAGWVVLSFALSSALVVVVNLFEWWRSRQSQVGPPSLD